MPEFWNSLITEKSWKLLQDIKGKFDFILIGGWAIYLLAKQQKSKDIDIVVSISELQKFKPEGLAKNDKLKKYEIKKEEIDIDIYVEHYSRLAIPVEDIKNYIFEIGGFKTASPELMIILKQQAYNERKNSIKGEKDLIDIMSLLLFSNPNMEKYFLIANKYGLNSFSIELKSLIKNFKDYSKLGLNQIQFRKLKEKTIEDFSLQYNK